MNFELQGRIILNRSPTGEDLGKDLDDFQKEVNETILTKGAPENQGAKVTDLSLNKDQLIMKIKSGQYVRAHDALLRLQKHLGVKLGKKYKIGARSIMVDTYKIEFSLDQKPINTIKVPFIKNITLDSENQRCEIILENLTEEFLRENYIDRIIKLIQEKIAAQYYAGKGERWKEIWNSGPRDHIWSKDPTDEMVKLGWLKQGPTKGKWFYNPQLTKIFRTMEEIAVKEILEPLGFQEIIQSHLVPFDIWMRTGHISGTPNEFYYVCEPKTRDVEVWEDFKDYVTITHQVPEDKLQKLVTSPTMGICYAQCPGMYWSFQGKVLADETLPVLIYDRAANSNRYESGGRHGIERVDEFHRLEPIYLGHPEQLIELREKFIDRYKFVFNEILEIEWRMAWVTPWYMEQSGQIIDQAEDEQIKGTIDFEAYLPYRGTRDDSEWLEYQNLSIIGDKFIKAFNIKTQHGDLWSGCSGIGLERWSAVFLAQKGLDPKEWPDKFQERFGEMPGGIQTM